MRYRDTWDIYRDIIMRYLRYFENLFQLSSSSSSGGFLDRSVDMAGLRLRY